MSTESENVAKPKAGSARGKRPLLQQHPKVQQLFAREVQLSEANNAEDEAYRQRMKELNAEIASAHDDIRRNYSEQRPDKAYLAECEADIAQLTEQKAKETEAHNQRVALRPASFASYLRSEFLETAAINKTWKIANVRAELQPEQSEADGVEECRAEDAALTAQIDAAKKSDLPVEAQIRQAHSAVDDLANRMKSPIVSVSKPDPRFNGSFTLRGFNFPVNTVATELSIQKFTDGAAIVAYLFGDQLKQKLADDIRARAKHVKGVALGIDERRRLIAELEAKRLLVRRRAEFFFREGQRKGVNTGQRLPPDFRAILSIEEA